MTSDARITHPPVMDEEAEAVLTACRVLVGLSAQSIAAAESVVDLTEFRILVILATVGPTNTAELADMTEIHHITARRLCDRLSSVNFVMLDQSQLGTPRTATLAPQGQGIVHMVMSRRRAAIEPVLAQMPISERTDLVTALRAFALAAGEASLRDLWAMGWTR